MRKFAARPALAISFTLPFPVVTFNLRGISR
jgi:hypothetical protein